MKNVKKFGRMLKTSISHLFFFVAGFLCFIGVITVLAAWPPAPAFETEGGWLGAVFDIVNSNESKLTIKGNAYAPAFFYASDVTLKENIQTIDNPIKRITQLNGVSFQWKKDGRQDLGLIAQEVETIFPELVSTNETTGLKSIEYGNLVAVLIEAVKEQQIQIEKLQ